VDADLPGKRPLNPLVQDDRLELWLVRHGQTTANLKGLLSGWHDVHLTERGQAQARELKQRLQAESFDQVWSSDLTRARETARIAHPGQDPVLDPRLREIDFGDLDGTPWADLPKEQQEQLLAFAGYQAPGGEGLDLFSERVLSFFAELRSGRHLVFCHGGVVRVVLKQLHTDRFPANGSLAVVDWTGKRLLSIFESPSSTPSAMAKTAGQKE
jgi:probable phosphoglycerate mutase